MKVISIYILFILTGLLSCNGNNDAHIQLVDISSINKNIILDIKYATTDNFLNEAVYSQARCFLVKEAALKIDSIQTELEIQGLGLKIFDGYRPFSVTEKMWQILPDNRYVANPKNGSRHNRGAAVDLTLVDSTGTELQMPTKFDDFTEKAAHGYQNLPEQTIKNRKRLKDIMEKYGFSAIKSEWWHYDLKNYQEYPILNLSFEEIDEFNDRF
jgi:D-alanyl-D-alanine dipeptidase